VRPWENHRFTEITEKIASFWLGALGASVSSV
jgi:hypothetical protein